MQVILREHNGAIFRRCEPSDLIGVMEINMKTLPEHYSDYFYESLLAEAPESFLKESGFNSHTLERMGIFGFVYLSVLKKS